MITLELGALASRFSADGRALTEVFPLGPVQLRTQCLHHAPPRPQELEAAIEAVEDILMPLHRVLPKDATLQVRSEDTGAFADLLADAGTREDVEDLFNRAAAIAQGRPAGNDAALADPEGVAALVIVREAMHHLGFTHLVLARA